MSVRELVAAELTVLRGAVPAHLTALARRLEHLTVHVEIGGERFWLLVDSDVALVDGFVGAADVRLSLDPRALVDIVEGRETLVALTDAGRIDAVGRVEDIERLFDCMTFLLRRLVRLRASHAPWLDWIARSARTTQAHREDEDARRT